jgi:hypothetical protein
MTITKINSSIKKQVISLMGKGYTSYSKKVITNNDFNLESEITISYESTCQIDVIVDYRLIATFNKENNKISLIQLN